MPLGGTAAYPRAVRIPVLLFAVGLLLRLLFWHATADRELPWALAFQGDAPVWQQQAEALAMAAATGQPPQLEELRLPLRPPGMTWLVAALWDGAPVTAWRLRLLFACLGALVAPLVFLLLRPLGRTTAVLAGGFCAIATNLMLLGSGPHNELPYLLLFLLTLFPQQRLAAGHAPWSAAGFGVLHGLACLLRAEHLLTFAAMLLCLRLQRAPAIRRHAAIACGTLLLTLLPWQWHCSQLIAEYNRSGTALPPPGIPLPPAFLRWDEAALARVRELPVFQQVPVFRFVDDTVRVRGGAAVTSADLDIVREAYDCWPEPLRTPLLSLYGGLNFFLANTPEADGGFSSKALDRTPPLRGGDHRYPPGLRSVLPRDGRLSLSYPPHLDLVLHGYRRGWQEVVADPFGALLRCGRKLAHAGAGLASGIGGYNAPFGLSGTRRPVDFVTADGAFAWLVRLALLACAGAGLWRVRGNPATAPWLWFLLSKLLVVVVFFGYARQGALGIPVLALGIGAALAPWLEARWRPTTLTRLVIAIASVALALEVGRWATSPSIAVDGQVVTGSAGIADRDFQTRQLSYR